MTREDNAPELRSLGLEPEDLNGYTLEQLSEYLDAGRTPRDPAIESSPGCRIAMDALERLRGLTPELFAADTAAEPEADESWVQRVMAGITLDARRGRRIPLPTAEEHVDHGITEGAVRGAMRSVENDVLGVLVGKSTLEGDVTRPGEPIRIHLGVSVEFGRPIADIVEQLREAVLERIRAHTDLNVDGIDVDVHDVHEAATAKGKR